MTPEEIDITPALESPTPEYTATADQSVLIDPRVFLPFQVVAHPIDLVVVETALPEVTESGS
jgi:hypothetical protein